MQKIPIKQIFTSVAIMAVIGLVIAGVLVLTWKYSGLDPDGTAAAIVAFIEFVVLAYLGIKVWKKIKEKQG